MRVWVESLGRTRDGGDTRHDVVEANLTPEVLQCAEQCLHFLLRRKPAEHLLKHRAHLVQRHARGAAALLLEGCTEVLLRKAAVILQADEVHVEGALGPQLRQSKEGHLPPARAIVAADQQQELAIHPVQVL